MKMLFAIALCLSTAAIADDSVRGHVRKDGTYVAPHMRTEPNSTRMDNYSTQGNTNPYTGREGHVNPNPAPSYGHTPQPTSNPYSNPYGTQQQPARNPYGTR